MNLSENSDSTKTIFGANGSEISHNLQNVIVEEADDNEDADPDGEMEDHEEGEADNNYRLASRGIHNRDYLKEMLMSHSLWRDGSFWEQALWQCTLEQV